MSAELGQLVGRIRLESSDPLIYLHTSSASGWSGACLTHIRTPDRGSFEGSWSSISISCALQSPHAYHLFSPAGANASRKIFVGLPDQLRRGSWGRTSEAANLFIKPAFVERVLGAPYNPARLAERARRLETDRIVEPLIHALLSDVIAGSPSGAAFGESVIAAIVHQLFAPPEGSNGRLSTDKMTLARDFIEANLGRDLHLDDIGAELGMSVRQFCRAFRRTMGATPYQYIMQRRIERAKALIAAGQLTLQEVAEAAGFADRNHMTTSFRKKVGATPTHFRRAKTIS